MAVEEAAFFYLAFECLLLLMYGYLAHQGYTARGTHALYMLVAYTVCGSALMALGMLLQHGATGGVSQGYTLLGRP